MKFYAIFGILVLTIIGFWFCQYPFEQERGKAIIPDSVLFDNIASQDSIFTFLAEEGFEYTFATGTEINIPKGALTDYNGKVVNGPVILSIGAYRDAIDLLAAGIMMDSGQGLNKTAGAFKIEVEQAGKQLILDPSKTIDVKLACYEKEADYGLCYFKGKENRWEYLYTATPTIHQSHVQLERQHRRMKPRIKFPLDEEYFALSYKGILNAVYNGKLSNVNHKLTQRKMEQYGLRWPDLDIDTLVEYEGKKVFASSLIWHNISRKHFPEWTKNKRGKLEKINETRYRLIVINDIDSKKFSTQIEAIMPLEKLFSYGPGYWKYDYYSKLKLVSATQSELETMPNTFRSFRINRFGIYNWQKAIDELESVKITVQIKQKNSVFPEQGFKGFYYLTGDSKGLIYYPSSQWKEIRLYADPEARIFAILPNSGLWLGTLGQMKAIDIGQLKKMNEPSFIFKMEQANRKPDSVENLRAILSHGFY